MVNKIVSRLSIRQANVIYKFFKIGFIFHNGQGAPFIED
ncbi:hypothetical protein CLCHR_32570 [Clostridium chromiireducens]|uniref:Uncharacterized protein n=1 Tax=Clostridium chromiireducens TaxID=225345 RepID=A0A1V4IIQ6_9CLOT|nr:hypothetical protein CLCHR_32570 [Clostridium chromiireducens]